MSFPLTCEDQMGNVLLFDKPPVRIVSLVPSITLTLFDLGLKSCIVGRTKFCIHPKTSVGKVPIVGGTKDFHIKNICDLAPDLIIANKEENGRDLVTRLQSLYNVYVSDVLDLESSYVMLADIGRITNTEMVAQTIIQETKSQFNALAMPSHSVAYLIWKDPWMVAGGNTFIDDILQRLNLRNIFRHSHERYPEVNLKMIQLASPEYIFLSSEPYPFKEKHMNAFSAICPLARISLVDGEFFSWYGSRLVESPPYFTSLLANQT